MLGGGKSMRVYSVFSPTVFWLFLVLILQRKREEDPSFLLLDQMLLKVCSKRRLLKAAVNTGAKTTTVLPDITRNG